jgi:hypothetical protein
MKYFTFFLLAVVTEIQCVLHLHIAHLNSNKSYFKCSVGIMWYDDNFEQNISYLKL